ncbi:G patch domain-containing protein 3 [Lonchura striata]|uniref:G patch domain-containing protein 3 n=1 Tax=Lonchura striata TaxID=40157 RepID=A0A218UL46_9PASE|nr:G patch domain-containing protein 3 [Lonchura striata domestica]
MAAPGGGGAARYCLVSGIPAALRSAHLRAYFSQFLEAGGFLCFHYRHRPERPPAGGGGASAPRTCCCPVSVRPGRARRFVRMYSGKRWVGPDGAALPGRCLIRRVRLSPGTGTGGRGRAGSARLELLAELPRRPEPAQRHAGPAPKTILSVLWDPRPSLLPAGPEAAPSRQEPEQEEQQHQQEQDQEEQQQQDQDQAQEAALAEASLTEAQLRRLPELNPPPFMPRGNVGTPRSEFLELIRACRLPPRLISRLQLDFPRSGSSRRYGSVPFRYPGTVAQGRGVYTAAGDEITEAPEPRGLTQPAQPREDEEAPEQEEEESHSDDVSGIFQHHFDEQTADDWDVDMSIYYDKDGGDKDARDSVQMWLERRLRDGLEDGSVSGQPIGTFERYTKGFGRKVLEQQGWTEGLGLGSSNSGMAEALDNEGQNPRCKRGLGYHGEKLPTFIRRKKPRADTSVVISTIYDDPEPQDMGDQLLRRQPPTAMKYRQDMAFVRASQPALGSLRAQPR